ncbi:MAG: hypothetical protein KIT14_04325 [bacterium]|nr:hypothetical protein [bacterium]
MRRTWKTLTIGLALGLGISAAHAAEEPFADLDNNGVFSEGDVRIGKALANDGQFSTDRAEANYKPPLGPVSVVFPGKFVSKKRALIVKASGNIIVNGDLSASGSGGVIFLVSSGGSVRIGDGVRFTTDSILQVVGMQDVTVGGRCNLRSKSGSFAMVSIASQEGDVTVGDGCQLGAGGMVEVTTGDLTGGNVRIGKGSRLVAGSGSLRVTAGGDLQVTDSTLNGRDVLMGSHRSTRTSRSAGKAGPGYASIRGSQIRSSGDGSVHLFASGGNGSTLDITKTSVKSKSRNGVRYDADVIVR